MKNFKRFASVVMVIMMMLSMMLPAMAASITIISSPTNGTDTQETYKAYKIFDATISGENIAYTIDSTNPFFNTIQNYSVNSDEEGQVFNLVRVNQTNTYIVNVNNANFDAALLADALKAVITDDTAVAGSVSSSTNGNYVINNLEEGYYLITSTLGSKMIIDTLRDITINTKNTYPSLTKKIVDGENRVDTITADRGNTITFEISVEIPMTAVGAITVHDILDSSMTLGALVENTIGVSVSESACEGCTVDYVISAETVANNLGQTVTFQYTATLNTDATTATAHKNNAWLTYSNFTSVKDEVTVCTYQLDVFKYTGTDENKSGLAGAGFVLMNSDNKYYCNNNGNVTWVEAINDATEYITSEENGYIVVFAGIKNGNYTLVEKTVPVGYNPAQNASVTINNANKTGDTQITVLNQSGTELPSTGGIGTTIFYCLGGAMVVGAFVLLITKKRMNREM